MATYTISYQDTFPGHAPNLVYWHETIEADCAEEAIRRATAWCGPQAIKTIYRLPGDQAFAFLPNLYDPEHGQGQRQYFVTKNHPTGVWVRTGNCTNCTKPNVDCLTCGTEEKGA